MTTVALCFATFLVTFVLAFLLGVAAGGKMEIRKAVREAGFTPDSAKLYGRAVRILRRLHGLTELDGDLAADILSPASRRLVADWLDDHRKLVEQGKGGPAAHTTGQATP
jgi:hypothetical protein